MYSKNKGADQLHGYREADLHLCFRICKIRFSHNAAQLIPLFLTPVLHFHNLEKRCLLNTVISLNFSTPNYSRNGL